MSSLKTLLALGRVSNLPTIWMNILTTAVLVSASVGGSYTIGLLVFAISCFYAGGMTLNDYCDRDWDTQHQPYRPIPSGRVRPRQVLSIALGLFATGFVFLFFAPDDRAPLAGLALLLVIVLYDALHKKHWSTVFLMALTRLGVYAVTAVALVGEVPALVWLAGGIQTVYTLAVTVVARWENSRRDGFGFPVIPWMIAAMGIVDGVFLAIVVDPVWLAIGVAATLLTRLSQRYVRGD
ncbi:4-hydroxybenzoate polyprenyltransferase [Marinimicrobium koreense]|uniref:4-hydroxybenzoate polyprenyltransferase n=1 Tax=Marinimicrobium koreense TaxID=306545 RepID=A0A3N1NZ80_9GAMM|nr:UbiA family prenyltransferase [Marinimicrobium koreense]ROQ20618.1 4-hydroxybenzoate polyprenyltransferase [Marinimicrobium koreense]